MSSPRYLIPAERSRTELEIERSQFITTLAHAPTADDARAFVESVRQEFPDATHNCWAFVAGPPGDSNQVGMSDDGEPSGTAGRPMLSVLLHSNVGEIAAVVTRYYGGVKLGTGGLVRAYTSGVQQAMEELPTRPLVHYEPIEVVLEYSDLSLVQRLLPEWEGVVLREGFTASVELSIDVPSDRSDAFVATVIDRTHGRAVIRRPDAPEDR